MAPDSSPEGLAIPPALLADIQAEADKELARIAVGSF
jgi:hypothetical protein